ncbi:cytochrome c oxidase subunit II [Breoghania sp. L-A4]|uniref:cytochrome c oxidase subunit II n=1 Tax=Breoghania sp. L-A4 TaxID=2304600 RepID=UPI000E35E5B6|nr:cytochrome c oxidase subunit II [Breoghania sp. L-A4]AXS39490.1 cytochrome c oxidase subunit II [Breoghania sp. L-A4]
MGMAKTGVGGLAALLGAGVSAASAAQPEDWQIGFQPAATEVMHDITYFNNFTLWIVIPIVLLVTALLGICIVRFNAKANPTPSRTTHNTLIEVLWTVVPILILVVIAVPSFRLLYKELVLPETELTIKATGYQWYWGYEYAEDGMEDVSFDSLMLTDEDRAERMAARGQTEKQVPRLLSVDNQLVVPVDTNVRVQVTAADVIHAFAMPAFGVKVDAIPGRLNETWFRADGTGVYYGQCSELCGKDHAFMPIAIRVVTKEQFTSWVEAAKDDMDAANALLASMIDADARNQTAATGAATLTVANR